jgi:hypothetical protein
MELVHYLFSLSLKKVLSVPNGLKIGAYSFYAFAITTYVAGTSTFGDMWIQTTQEK